MRGIIFENTTEFAEVGEMQQLIKDSIKRIVMTAPRERVNNLTFGFGARNYLFSPLFSNIGEFTGKLKTAIEQWEPRVLVNSIKTSRTGQNSIKIYIRYLIKEFYLEEQYLEINVGV